MPLDILLLGGSGFVGRALLREIASMPEGSVRVRALLRDPSAVPDYAFLDKVKGDLEALPPDLLHESGLEPSRPYVLVHFAVKHIDRDGSGFTAINVDATRSLLGKLGPRLKGILYRLSMAVYGQGAQDGVTERAPLRADTPLAHSRLWAEAVITNAARERGITAFLLRPRFVVGEGDRFVLPALAKLVRRGVGIASGAQRFSVIDVADYARILVRLAAHVVAREGDAVQEALNIGHARPVSFAQIAEALGGQTRVRLPVSLRITRLLRRVPLRAFDQTATRLELIGFSHWGDVASLEAKVGSDIVHKDPMIAVTHAARILASGSAT